MDYERIIVKVVWYAHEYDGGGWGDVYGPFFSEADAIENVKSFGFTSDVEKRGNHDVFSHINEPSRKVMISRVLEE